MSRLFGAVDYLSLPNRSFMNHLDKYKMVKLTLTRTSARHSRIDKILIGKKFGLVESVENADLENSHGTEDTSLGHCELLSLSLNAYNNGVAVAGSCLYASSSSSPSVDTPLSLSNQIQSPSLSVSANKVYLEFSTY